MHFALQNWETRALCHQMLRAAPSNERRYWQDAFFPTRDQNALTAKSVCARCPVKDQCLNDALTRNETHGVWGGMTPNERKAEKRLRRRKQLTQPHAT